MNNNNLKMDKNRIAKLLLAEMVIASLSLTGCSGNNKASNTSPIN